MDNTSIGDRMKGYEKVYKNKLLRRTPTIIRLDGKSFHTWTKQLKKVDATLEQSPFSDMMFDLMLATTNYLVNNIQNAVIGYSQSDEISILLNDWKTLKTDQWFGGSIQKMASVSASMATMAFNEQATRLSKSLSPALFDARVYNVPMAEVTNSFIWRQQDATRNSIQMLGQFHFSHKEMQHKNVSQVQDMLMLQKGINWNDIETRKKRGFCVSNLAVDTEIPIFTKERDYIEQWLAVEMD